MKERPESQAEGAGAPAGSAAGIPIAAVERDTGLSKDTLRIWERRYGFPRPARDTLGERTYPRDQVEKLRLLKRLMDAGHRPGKLMPLEGEALQALAATAGLAAGGAAGSEDPLGPYRAPLAAHDGPALRRRLQQVLLARGLERFVVEEAAALNAAVGEAWMRGELGVAQEHVYTEALQQVLRQALGGLPEPAPDAVRVLLATLPQELHGLGLLMAEALLALHGCRCISLGTRVPADAILSAAAIVQPHVVGLSFTGSFNPVQALDALRHLRHHLPRSTALWVGGRSLVLQRRLPAGVEAVPDIARVPDVLQRVRHAGSIAPA